MAQIQKEAPKAIQQSEGDTRTTARVITSNNDSSMQHGFSPRRAMGGVRHDTRREQKRREAQNP